MHIGAHRDEPRGGAPVNHAAYNWFCECGCGAVGADEPPRRCPQCGRRVWAADSEDVYPRSMFITSPRERQDDEHYTKDARNDRRCED